MQLILTNTNLQNVPITIDQGDVGTHDMLVSTVPFTLDMADATVAIIGHKPAVREQLGEAANVLGDTATAIAAGDPGSIADAGSGPPEALSVIIENNSEYSVRVILGDGVTDYNMAPHTQFHAQSRGYIELRELGDVDSTIEQQPSSAA
jgi:hypothetical protein